MTKHYVEFIYPGFFVADTYSVEIEERDPKKVVFPEARAAGFRFYSQVEAITENNEVLKGSKKDISGWYYKGREMTLEDVKREMPDQRILISNMEINKWDSIVKLDCGQCYPLEKNDVVLKEEASHDVVDELRAE